MVCPVCTADNPTGVEHCGRCGTDLAGTPGLRTGAVIANRYEILGLLGKGGMGVVFKAHDRLLDETVAIKVLRGDVPVTEQAAERFRAEIKLARRVTHRNVCRIHEYGEDGGLHYISMAFVDGMDLRTLLRQGGRLPPEEALETSICVADAVAAIHAEGVLHRDLKTANIMRDQKGVIRLMDFGLAKEHGAQGPGLTVTGQIMGTAEYMSPEQAQGHALDPRSDVYALGVIVFELFTGRVPFHGSSPLATLMEQVHKPPPLDGPAAAGIPPPLIPLLCRALAKDPDHRFGSAAAMAAALRRVRGGGVQDAPSDATTVTRSEPVRVERVRLLQRRLWLLVGAQLLLALPAPLISQESEGWKAFGSLSFCGLALGLLILIPLTVHELMRHVGARAPLLWAVSMLVPCANILLVAVIGVRVSRWLRPAGIEAGFLGPTLALVGLAAAVTVVSIMVTPDVTRRSGPSAPPSTGPAAHLQRACDGGHARSCTLLAAAYDKGDGVAKDPARAAALHQRACERGDLDGCTNAGAAYAFGNAVGRDDAKAARFFGKACQGREPYGCNSLGILYQSGRGVAQDPAKAAALYQQACDGGHAEGCNNLGVMLEQGLGVPKDGAKAIRQYQKACEGGSLFACHNLGLSYAEGRGVAADPARAATIYQANCDRGHADSCFNLGQAFELGRGVAKDPARAASMYQVACDRGSGVGCNNLGVAYLRGLGVPRDPARAATLVRQACDQGTARGCSNLAWCYSGGTGVERDPVKAAAFRKRACDLGDADSCAKLQGGAGAGGPPPSPSPLSPGRVVR